MGSDWVYYTNIRPMRQRSKGEEGNNEYKVEFDKAYVDFLKECKVSIDELESEIVDKGLYIHSILTDKNNDIINKNSNYHVRFSKSRFLSNMKFKRSLIDYYNPLGYFINGPNFNGQFKWDIEITKKNRMF